MKANLNRRSFLKRTALAAAALSATRLRPGPNILAATGTIDKLNCVQIGCGGRGMSAHLDQVGNRHRQNLYAIVDPDAHRHAEARRWLKGKDLDGDRVQVFTEYRAMLETIGEQTDAGS